MGDGPFQEQTVDHTDNMKSLGSPYNTQGLSLNCSVVLLSRQKFSAG